MRFYNRIKAVLCAAVMTVSFLHPFFGEMEYTRAARQTESGESLNGPEQGAESLQEVESLQETEPGQGASNLQEAERRAEILQKTESEAIGAPKTEQEKGAREEAAVNEGKPEDEGKESGESPPKTEQESENASETEAEEKQKGESQPEAGQGEGSGGSPSKTEEKAEEESEGSLETEAKEKQEGENLPETGQGKEGSENLPKTEQESEESSQTEVEEKQKGESLSEAEADREAEGLTGAEEISAVKKMAASLTLERAALLPIAASSIGISGTSPKAGQQNRYEYSGTETTWTVPATGYYDLYCYGAQGGRGGGDGESADCADGSGGAMRGARAFLEKGTALTIHAGQMPAAGRCSYGEGSTNGNKFELRTQDTVSGFVTGQHWKTKDRCGDGEYTIYRGWGDGGYGEETHIMCDNDGNHSGGAVGGGGGGSSYILCQGVKILSAKGGTGGSVSYKCKDGSGHAAGGSGGGVTALAGAPGVRWETKSLDTSKESAALGNGYALIRVVNVSPVISLRADTGWTNGDVQISVSVQSVGQGLSGDYLSWESDETGKDVWCAETSHTVSENGTYQCKIRDTAGNLSQASITVKNIDKSAPQAEISSETEDWTKGDVRLTVSADDTPKTAAYGESGFPEDCYSWELDEQGEAVWTKEASYTAAENGSYVCRVRDRAGNITEQEFCLRLIDRTAPRFTCRREEKWYQGDMKVCLEAEDLQPDGSKGSGLADDAYSIDGLVFQASPEFLIAKEGEYSMWVTDRLGNQREEKFAFYHDEKEKEPEKENPQEEEPPEEDTGSGKRSDGKKTPEPTAQPAPVSPIEEEEAVEIGDASFEGSRSGTASPEEAAKRTEKRETAKPYETQAEPQIIPEALAAPEPPGQVKLLPLPEAENETPDTAAGDTTGGDTAAAPAARVLGWKRVVIYSVWLAAVLCGLVWLLFCLIFEHVSVYRRDTQGKYRRIGRCAILRKQEYKQVNLCRLMEKGEERDYKIRFSEAFALLHAREKVLIRTWYGAELYPVEKEIEIVSCNSENHMLT